MSDFVGITNLILSSITATSATYLAYAVLKHSARPKIQVFWRIPWSSTLPIKISNENQFVFDIINVGYWYAKPPARDVHVEFTCSNVPFKKMKLENRSFGDSFKYVATEHRTYENSTRCDVILAAPAFTLYSGEQQKFAIVVVWREGFFGNGSIILKAHSSDGAFIFEEFHFEVEQRGKIQA